MSKTNDSFSDPVIDDGLPTVRPSSSFGHRVVTRFACSALGTMLVRKVGSRIDPALIRLSGAQLSSVAPFPAMLLTHTGAMSGVTHTSTVVYFSDPDRLNAGPVWYGAAGLLS